MFEAHVLHLLRKYLGEYVQGLSSEALRISVWKGDVVLKDLQLKAEALNALRLPIRVRAGFVGAITLKVPWKSLGKEPVIVLIDQVFVLAHPSPDGHILKEEDRDKLFKLKLQKIEEAESATLEAKSKRAKQGDAPAGNSWLGSFVATIIGNLKITISNVHVRYEDSASHVGHPFCCGITLAKLAAVTTDEHGNEIFDTSGALDRLRKSLQLERLAAYHDSDTEPWNIDKNWEDLSPREWMEIFGDGISASSSDGSSLSPWALNRKYLISPINGLLKYHRLGEQERKDASVPFEKASLVLSDVSVTISEAQYHDGIKILEAVSRYRARAEVSHLRPMVTVVEDPCAWWQYTAQASLQQKKIWLHFSWDKIRNLCELRRRYIQLYAMLLQQTSVVDTSEIREIEKDLDSNVILLWRLLAHAKVETKEAALQKVNSKRSWWSFGWRSSSGDLSEPRNDVDASEMLERERLTKEEWHAINKLLSYQPNEKNNFSGMEMQNMMHSLVAVTIHQGAAHFTTSDHAEIVCGRFDQLHVVTKQYHKSVHCDICLKFYGLSAPDGQLVQSISSKRKQHALAASFIYSPGGVNVDWQLSATIAPCHVTVLMESLNRFINFVKSSHNISPSVASETAAALQIKIEEVSRKAQEQLYLALEDQNRFALDIDFDAPKVVVPIIHKSFRRQSCFLLDCGHFTLKTKNDYGDDQRQNLYSSFYILGKDIAASFMDGKSMHENGYFLPVAFAGEAAGHPLSGEMGDSLYSLIDRCGIAVVIDQIKLRHPRYPSTRISVQVPCLSAHLSPERYSQFMALLDIVYVTTERCDQSSVDCLNTSMVSRLHSSLATNARILVWRGIGNTVAEWKPCFLVLSGLYLYVLESELAKSYQRCASLVGRQILEIPPSSVSGSLFCLAICFQGAIIQKALESSNSLIIEFCNDGEKAKWLKGLTRASYRASTQTFTGDTEGHNTGASIYNGTFVNDSRVADLVLSGTLYEAKLFIYGKIRKWEHGLPEELIVLEMLAQCAQIKLAHFGGDLTVKARLQSLEIKDMLQGQFSSYPQYLACSVVKDLSDNSCPANPRVEVFPKACFAEDDNFKDALPDFMSTSNQSFCLSSFNLPQSSTNDKTELRGQFINGDSSRKIFSEYAGEKFEFFSSEELLHSDADVSDFISVSFASRSSDSSNYDGTDAQMSIRMTKLEFFCNRPTLVALVDFGIDMSNAYSSSSSLSSGYVSVDNSEVERMEEGRHSYIKGLLGYGKGRIVFNLRMDVASVCVFLNKEDGSQLAMLVQERFLLNIKVHPSSVSIEGTLGNLRLCDMSLGKEHYWGWLCDLRDQDADSLIKFVFQSYSVDDDDYDGYDYSMQGHLSAVRIIFLFRFVQEIVAYFMELATPHTEEAIKYVDRVGGLEWLIQKYEIEGSSAIKLDLSLDTPLIIVPRDSLSRDFMQLDLGQLQVNNYFSWHGCPEKDPSAVHLGVLHAMVHGINMAVSVNGHLGKFMIKEAEGIQIEVHHPLRDVFRKIPTFSIYVKIGLLHGIMSDKEYGVIVDCFYTNLCEVPNLPPTFRGTTSKSKESMQMIVDKIHAHSQTLLSRTVSVVAVEVKCALLELCNEVGEILPLAHLTLEGLWVSYRVTSLEEVDLYVTVPKFSILDARAHTRPEMRLLLGSYADLSRQTSFPGINYPTFMSCSLEKSKLVDSVMVEAPNMTMLLLDYRIRSSSQSFVIRIQQPRILVVLDFVLALCEYFVPSLRALTGREEILDPEHDPLSKTDSIIFSGPTYFQQDKEVHLSPARQLIVDGHGTDEFIYDGCGGTIYLSAEEPTCKGWSAVTQPIVIIGRGKRLRFKNVKIESGDLLRRFTYLNNDSCYLVLEEDGVEISFLESVASQRDTCIQNLSCEPSGISSLSPAESIGGTSAQQSFTFEAQVVSSEFTFYDNSKLCFNGPVHIEKFLRAKVDWSFMFASKGNDRWLRASMKDLTVEAGSGLVVVDPVDVSAGYASIKDKVNISIISSEVFVHLSLSVISLVLHLQAQATAALLFGKVEPLASCVNFDRIWLSSRDESTLSCCNISFWRPHSPSGYVILGDCVTSRATPPSQAVAAVCNIYGRVKKPLGFKLVGLFSTFQESEGDMSKYDAANDCSLWMPIAPMGYSAIGCVATTGSQPPPVDIVYCLRNDLVASTKFLECCFAVEPNLRISSGFSIWRIDNAVGSFIAQATLECPPKRHGCDLHQILIRPSNLNVPSKNASASHVPSGNNCKSLNVIDNMGGSSGWGILLSVSKPNSFYISTPHFERVWWDKGCDLRRPVSVWRPVPRLGFSILGDCIAEGLEPPALGVLFKCDSSGVSTRPVQFIKVAHILGRGLDEAFFWYPVAPPGFASLGCVISRTDEAPSLDIICCPRLDHVQQSTIQDVPVSRSSSMKGSRCWSIWKVGNMAGTFLARSDLKKPSKHLAYGVSDYAKARHCEDVNVELKLGCLSVTILDSLYGMMTPLFDVTITNINLATYGRLESMNAVLISSIVVSTFNLQLEAWEPLVEPFDGIFKLETYNTIVHLLSRIGKKVRIAVTSPLNLNVSAANLGTITQTLISWRRQAELELKSTKEDGTHLNGSRDVVFSVLEEDDFEKVVIENKLDCDIYLKTFVDDSEDIRLLKNGENTSARLLPPCLYDRLNGVAKSWEPHFYIGVQVLEAKGLHIVDDGSNHSFFCAIRLVPDGETSDQQKLFPQSARTRSIVNSEAIKANESAIRWNELFIFEVPQKGIAKLEVEVTDLALCSGKGEVIGSSSISFGSAVSKLKRASSMRLLQQPVDVHKFSVYSLKKQGQSTVGSTKKDSGCLLLSIYYFDKNRNTHSEANALATDGDVSFALSLYPEGPWVNFRSLLPLTVAPKAFNEDLFATEVMMKDGQKHFIIRSLAVGVNEADISLEVAVFSTSTANCDTLSSAEIDSVVTEEVFENERYNPDSGWGSMQHVNHANDPARWSTRDFSYSSKDFFEPRIPPGWQWIAGWAWEKSHFVDSEGWAYGADFDSLRWPPAGPKSSQDFVRRRRWIRNRRLIPKGGFVETRNFSVILKPKSSAVLPWESLAKDSDMCLHVRPYAPHSQSQYTWSHVVTVNSHPLHGSAQSCPEYSIYRDNTMKAQSTGITVPVFKLNEMEKKDVLLCCDLGGNRKQRFWLSVGSDAAIMHTELNSPVYDWKISFTAPLKLENKLPCQTEYSVWEKMEEGNRVQRHHSVISPNSSVFIYSVDLRKPIYLTLFCQGGWVLEKDSVLILDHSSSELVSSFWMVHQKSKRRLRVYLERDFGGTSVAAKTIRLFVPYWISNDSHLPLVFHIVEVELVENAEADSRSLSRAVKSAKLALKRPTSSRVRQSFSSGKVIQILEVIEESSAPIMLSPREYLPHSNASLFPSRSDALLSPRVGVAVSLYGCKYFSPGISLIELENKERVDVRAFDSNGSYYKLSAVLNMVSNRIKVIHFQPHTLIVNRTGCTLQLQQCDARSIVLFQPTALPKIFKWDSSCRSERLKLRLDGFKWSAPFSIQSEGTISIWLKSETHEKERSFGVEVQNGLKCSRYEVIFRPASFTSTFRVENCLIQSPLRIRQVDGEDDAWKFLPPNCASSFCWEDLVRKRMLEVLIDGNDPLKSQRYSIEEVGNHVPTEVSGVAGALHVTVAKEGTVHVVKISHWMTDEESFLPMPKRLLNMPQSGVNRQTFSSDSEFHAILELSEFGISLIDHTPEEILYVNVKSLTVSYSSGLEAGISRFKLRMRGIQVDNQLPLTSMPVLFRAQRIEGQHDYMLKLSITSQSSGSVDFCIYPYIGLQGPENSAFLVNVHEPIIWRLHEMIQRVKPVWFLCSQTTAVSVDPTIQIGLLNISEIRFKVSLAMSPNQRPRGVLGFWSSLMTALGNTENMPIRVNQRFLEDICMRQSALISTMISNVQKDLLSQPLQLLSGVDILSNASSALGHMSKGVAALSMDEKFIQSRKRQENKGIEDIADVIREGGGAFAKGLFRGVSGILTKPLEGAKSSGVEGFVQGVGKGIIGAAAQPVSGVLDLLSKTTEGANAMRMKISSAITSEEQLFRRRLPRVIGADNLVHLYDEYKAEGQIILQLAESGAFFGQSDLFKIRGKFALSDAYEDHFLLPKGKIAIVTHQRVLLLQQPSNIMAQRKFIPARDPCSVVWDVSWEALVTLELAQGKKDNPKSPPSHLVLYLPLKSLDSKDSIRVIKCTRGSQQAFEVYRSIDQAINSYGPRRSKGMPRKVTKPYSACANSISSEVVFEQACASMWGAQEKVGAIPVSTSFGTVLGQPLLGHEDPLGPRCQ